MYEQRLQGSWHHLRVGNILSYAGISCMILITLTYIFVFGAVSREDQLHPSSHGYGAGAAFFGIGPPLLLLMVIGWIVSLIGLLVVIRKSRAAEKAARGEIQSPETERHGLFVGGFLSRLGIIILLLAILLLFLIMGVTSANWKDMMDVFGNSFLLLVAIGGATLLVGLAVALLEKRFGAQVEDFFGRASIGIILLVLLLQILPLSNVSNSYNILSGPFSLLQLVIVTLCFMIWLTDLILWNLGRVGFNKRRREERYAEERWHGLQTEGFLSRMGISIAFFFLLMEGSSSLLNPFWWVATTGLVLLLLGLIVDLRGRLVRKKFVQDARERPRFVEGQHGSPAKKFLSRIGIDILLLLIIVVGFTLMVNAWSASNLVNNANIYSIWVIFAYPLPFFAAIECIISIFGLTISVRERARGIGE